MLLCMFPGGITVIFSLEFSILPRRARTSTDERGPSRRLVYHGRAAVSVGWLVVIHLVRSSVIDGGP